MGEKSIITTPLYWMTTDELDEVKIESVNSLSTKDDEPSETEWNAMPSWTGTWTGTVSIDGNDTVYKNIMRLFKHRLPRKVKKAYKKRLAQRIGIPADKLRFSNPCWF